MGGWIAIFGDVSDFEHRLHKFRKIFSVECVPDLRVEVCSDIPEMKTICWAWNNNKVPDVYVVKRSDSILILCGVITDLGRFGPASSRQQQVAERLFELLFSNHEESEIISQLNGSFSCLLYNQKTKRVSIFTDRFSSRSVWMTEEGRTWIIGNFPSAVANMKNHNPKIDPVGLWSLFHTGRHLGVHGIYHNIHTLSAGKRAVLIPGRRATISQWWKREYYPQNSVSPFQWGCDLAEALVKSANRYKNVCNRPYLFLSGGLDSRIIAAAFRNHIKALTLSIMPNAESRIASLVSNVLGIDHQVILRSPYWYLDTLNAAALISSGNFLTKHTHFIVPVRNICAESPESEFFLGDLIENFNNHYFSLPSEFPLIFNPENIKNLLVRSVPCTIKDTSSIGLHFNHVIQNSIEERYEQALQEYAMPILSVSNDHADCFDTFLRWADVSMTYSYNMFTCIWPLASERNVYFDNELDDLSLKIPARLRGAGKIHRWILYHLDKKLFFIPDSNSFLPPFLSNKAKNLTKKIRPFLGKLRRNRVFKRGSGPKLNTSGSWVLNEEIYRKDPRYRAQIDNIIMDNSLFPPEIFNCQQIRKTWQEYLAGNLNRHFEIEVLLSFGILNKKIPFGGIDL